jgi:predicted RNA-binding protein with PUA-like domain
MSGAWLVKQEPSAYPFELLMADGRTTWDGVRNSTARIHLRAMKRGDRVLYYHSGEQKAVVGLARVARAAYPDPTAKEGDWVAVDLAADAPLARPVTLAAIKADASFADFALVRMSRLSVMPVSPAQLARILAMAKRA